MGVCTFPTSSLAFSQSKKRVEQMTKSRGKKIFSRHSTSFGCYIHPNNRDAKYQGTNVYDEHVYKEVCKKIRVDCCKRCQSMRSEVKVHGGCCLLAFYFLHPLKVVILILVFYLNSSSLAFLRSRLLICPLPLVLRFI